MRFFSLVVIAALVIAESTAAGAAQESQLQEALNTIADFADRLCQTVPLETRSELTELSGKAQADLGGVVKKLGSLGISGAAKYSTSESQNVLQKDLAETLKGTRTCRLQIWNDLKSRFQIPDQTAKIQRPNPNAAPRLPAECSRLTDGKLKRQPAIVFDQWVGAVRRMKAERAVYDVQNLVETWGRMPVGLDGKELVAEAIFTLKCLEKTKILTVTSSTAIGSWWGVQFQNDTINFH